MPATLLSAQEDTDAKARNLTAEGDQMREGQQDPGREIRDEPNQHTQGSMSAKAIDREDANQTGESNLLRFALGAEHEADQIQVPADHRAIIPEVRQESHESAENRACPGLGNEAPRVEGVETSPFRAAPDLDGSASGHVKVWSQDTATHHRQQAGGFGEPANPIYILAAITLGLPALALIALVGMNPGVQDGTFMTLLTFLVISAFVIAAVFEIKRLADQRSNVDDH
ncbi:hypothetical protein [Microvirga sp. TS319]|uniref:hypothetical protein n=1 Tax=Microvirga sp. TS319 TaxID=3241165 RepID=UPI00351A4F6D